MANLLLGVDGLTVEVDDHPQQVGDGVLEGEDGIALERIAGVLPSLLSLGLAGCRSRSVNSCTCRSATPPASTPPITTPTRASTACHIASTPPDLRSGPRCASPAPAGKREGWVAENITGKPADTRCADRVAHGMYTATTTRASLFHKSPSLARSFRAAYLGMRPRPLCRPWPLWARDSTPTARSVVGSRPSIG